MKKYYDILGLECGSTEEKTKSVYKKLAKIYHPDMPDTGNEKMFKKINEAFSKIQDNDFKCGEYSDNDNYQEEKKENHNQYKDSNHDKDYYRNATAGVITGIFDGLIDIFLSIFKINFFSKVLNFIKLILILILDMVFFVYHTITRFFLRYGWSSLLLIVMWPIGLIVLFLELFRYDEPIESKEGKRNWVLEILVVISVIGILAGILFVAIDPKVKTINNKNIHNNILKNKEYKIFNEKALTPLKNGYYKKYYSGRGVAPIKIKTKEKGIYYFVKIVDAYTGKLVKEIFIHGGKNMETKLPIGNYKIKYATGKEWYGKKYLFGPSTNYSEADDIFNFYLTKDGYMGYTIELFLQINGNLKTNRIDKNDF